MNQVGRYQIQEELGRGAMGVVYKAFDPAIGRTVALKAIRLADLTDPLERRQMRERLFREAQIAQALSHPNLVRIYDVLEHDDFVYVVMEYLPCHSLGQLMQSETVPAIADLVQYLQQVAAALDYAHRKGVVHRDIKPADILISDAETATASLAKVAGFGVAKFVPHAMSNTGTIIGTPEYMSPEQIQGTPIDGRSDEFSLGVVVYELLTGSKPFKGDQLPALFYSICKQDPAPAHQVKPALSEAAGKVLQRALMKNPEQRFPSCGEFVGALSIALGEASPAPSASSIPVTRPTARAYAEGAAAEEFQRGPVITIPDEQSFELPTRIRRRREEELLDSEPPRKRSSGGQKLVLILAMCFAIGATIVFIVMSNSGPTVPVQVLDTRSGPVTPPPEGMEVASHANPAPGQNAPSRTQTNTAPNSRHKPELSERASRSSPTLPSSLPASLNRIEARGTLRDVELLTEPPGAKMALDGRSDQTCNSPCTLSVSEGRHTLTAELGGYNIGRRTFTTPDEASLFVNLGKSMGVVVVTSTLSGCSVMVDGRPSGQTPATLHLTEGSHRIAVVSRASRHEETVVVRTDGFDVEKFLCQ